MPLYLSIYGLVNLSIYAQSNELASGLDRYLGHFKVPRLENPPDIKVEPLDGTIDPADLKAAQPSPYGMALSMIGGQRALVFHYCNQPDLVLILSDIIRLYYTPRKKNFFRIYGLLLFSLAMILRLKKGLLFHGAAVFKDQKNAILLTGLRGAKKTQLLLCLLQKKWNYISDDKLILHQGKMYMFQDMIPVTDHHIQALPWLYDMLPVGARSKKSPFRRMMNRRLAKFSRRYINKHLLPVMEKFYAPYLSLSLADLFPDAQKSEGPIAPKNVVVLSLGEEISCQQEETGPMMEEISAIQQLQYYSMGPLEVLIYFCNKQFPPGIRDIVPDNLARVLIYRLSISAHAPMEEVVERMLAEIA